MKLRLIVFASLLVVLTAQAVSASCIGKTVQVLVANAQDLTGDGWKNPDPYVLVSIGDETHRTCTIQSNANPVWWQTFTFKNVSNNLLKIQVWEQDTFIVDHDDHLGTCVEAISQGLSSDGESFNSIDCVVVHSGRVKVFYKCPS